VKRFARTGIETMSGWGLKAFTKDDLDSIHGAILELLGDVGVRVDSEAALDVFHAGGCKVERKGGHGFVKIPAYVVEDCIRAVPRKTIYKGRIPESDYAVEPNRVSFCTYGEVTFIIDPETRKARETSYQDTINIARLCDASDVVGVQQRPVASCDKPRAIQPVYNAQALFENTSKHLLIGPINVKNLNVIFDIAAAHVGGMDKFAERPIFTTIVCPNSPLWLEKDCSELIIETAKVEGGGVHSSPVPLAGVTTPVTLAGSVASCVAESLSGIILAQLVRKGTRVTMSEVGTIMDVQTMATTYGAPEMSMMVAALAQMGQYYGIPTHGTGIQSDAKMLDPQTGYDSAMGALTCALGGLNFINGLGSVEVGNGFDYAKFMLDEECARNVIRILEGVPVSDVTLALDVIRETGPGGNLLGHDHTYKNFRSLSRAKLFDRQTRGSWAAMEQPNIVERAYAAAKERYENHQPAPVKEEVKQEVAEIIEKYRIDCGL